MFPQGPRPRGRRRRFEARCKDGEAVEYLWHLECGLRADKSSGATVLITDPALLPEEPWLAT